MSFMTRFGSNPAQQGTAEKNMNSERRGGNNGLTDVRTSSTLNHTWAGSGTDPSTCLEVFKSHWTQVLSIMNGINNVSPAAAVHRSASESINAVIRYKDHMVVLLVEEESDPSGAQGPILQYMLQEDILTKFIVWSENQLPDLDRLKVHNLKMFELIIAQSRQQIFLHKPTIRPLMQLLASCEEHKDKTIEQHLLLVLGQLCVAMSQKATLLEVLFSASPDQGATKFLIFSLLIPYIHREGLVGQQARDALLLIMALSARNDNIRQHIAQNSDFCPVLATGLSGLYSDLPRKMNPSVDDWHCIREEDVGKCRELVMFLNSLEFCNAVVQVAYPLVADQLLNFIYNGFLVPVMAPALHQNEIILNDLDSDNDDSLLYDDADIFKLPLTFVESYFLSSMEEVIAATAYLDLFIRKVSEPNLIRVFVRLIVMEKYDDVSILESLISRIQSNSRLCMVTMALFRTLVDLNCEDVMFQLIFRYLIPCAHVMVSQRRAVRDMDLYGKTAEKLLALQPHCCKSCTVTAVPLSALPTIQTPGGGGQASEGANHTSLPETPNTQRKRRGWRGLGGKGPPQTNSGQPTVPDRMHQPNTTPSPVPSPSTAVAVAAAPNPEVQREIVYLEYLEAARIKVKRCAAACQCWSAPYDGETPSSELLAQACSALDESCSTMDKQESITGAGGKVNGAESSTGEGANAQNKATHDKKLPKPNENVIEMEKSGTSNTGAGETGTVNDRLQANGGDSKRNGSVENETVVNSLADNENETTQPDIDTESNQKQKQTAETRHTSHPPTSLSLTAPICRPNFDSTETVGNQDTKDSEGGSLSDSPLNDEFNESDFQSFLQSLKRVATPIELSDSMEDCLRDIEAMASEFKINDSIRKPIPINRARSDVTTPCGISGLVSHTEEGVPGLFVAVGMRKSMSMFLPGASGDHAMKKSVSMHAVATSTPAKQHVVNAPIFTPTKYNIGTPNIGPFLNTLLGKVEAMMQNSLYVNLLLTELVTRLTCYPQPLLRSILLNHSLVFQPTVKSLIQVLGSVKHKVDAYAYTVKDFDTLMVKARQFLAWREAPVVSAANQNAGRMRSDSNLSLAPGQVKEKKKVSSFGDFLRRNLAPQKLKPQNQPRLQLLETGAGFRYIHRRPSPDESEENPIEALRAKNAVYCAIVLEEFIQELAAVSQQHAVLDAHLLPS